MNWAIIAPIIITALLFLIEICIKVLISDTYDFGTILFEIGPKLCIWAFGISLTLTITKVNWFLGKPKTKVKPKDDGHGFEIDYYFETPENYKPDVLVALLPIIAVLIWLISTLISFATIEVFNCIKRWDFTIYLLTIINIIISGSMVGLAILYLSKEQR